MNMRLALFGSAVFLLMHVSGIPCWGAENAAVAVVNGVALTERDLQEVLEELVPRSSYHASLAPEKMDVKRKEALDELIKRELYYQEAERAGLKVTDAQVKELFASVKQRYQTTADFQKALKAEGFTEQSYKKKIERHLLIQKLYDEEVAQKALVSEQFLKTYYEKNRGNYLRPEAFRVRHILIKVDAEATKEEREKMRKKAEDVWAKAKAGEDFGRLAWDYSMDAYRVKEGDLGLIHRGRLVPEVEDAALKLEPGSISDIIESIYGFHIVKLEEKKPPMQMTFEEVKDKLKKDLEEKRKKENEEALLKRLKESATIKVFEESVAK